MGMFLSRPHRRPRGHVRHPGQSKASVELPCEKAGKDDFLSSLIIDRVLLLYRSREAIQKSQIWTEALTSAISIVRENKYSHVPVPYCASSRLPSGSSQHSPSLVDRRSTRSHHLHAY